MKHLHLLITLIFVIILSSCKNNDEIKLKEHLQEEYTLTKSDKKLSSGSKAIYIQMEESLNKRYVQELDSLVNTYFDRQIEKFEDQELGVWNSYMNMFSWMFKSKDSWDRELLLISKKYFNNLDNIQEQNQLYNAYAKQIKDLREQFLKTENLPEFTQINIPSEDISLAKLVEHSRNNIGIEIIGEFLGGSIFAWLLGIFLTWFCVAILGLFGGPPGWVVTVIAIIIGIGVSVILTSVNDSKLIDNLREQHEKNIIIDNNSLLNTLNENTIHFYQKL